MPQTERAQAEYVMPAATVTPHAHRILIAEDNLDLASTMAALMKMWGHVPVVVCDGQAALDEATRDPPCLMILDLTLPQLDGCEVALRIRQASGAPHIALLALSGFAEAEYRERALQVGFDAYMVKPASADALRGAIDNLIRDNPDQEPRATRPLI
jgi:DNA-binding response OmpR family regulator